MVMCDASVLPVGAQHVVPHRSVLGLHAGSVLFRGIEHRLCFDLVADRLELQILSDPVQVSDAGALNRERLLFRKARPVVADQTVCAFLQRVVREVGLPLNDRRSPRADWPGRRARPCRRRRPAPAPTRWSKPPLRRGQTWQCVSFETSN